MPHNQNGQSPVSRAILAVERVAGVILGLVTVLIFASAIGRYIFASPIPDAFDLSRLLLGVAIAWGLASLGFHGTHIKVDLLAQALPSILQRAMNAVAWAVLLGFTALLVWKIGERLQSAFASGDVTMDMRLPHWAFFLGIWLGLVAALFTTVVRLWLIAVQGRGLGEFESVDDLLLREDESK